jgi:hypothetical protein
MILIDFFFSFFFFPRDFFSPFFFYILFTTPYRSCVAGPVVCVFAPTRSCVCSFYPSTQTGQPNEISDSFQDFMSQVEELDNLEEFQMDLNTMGVIPAGMTHFKS